MSIGWPVQLMRGVRHLLREGSRRIGDQGHMIAQFHREAARGFNARIGQEANDDDLLDAILLELLVEVRVGKTALSPMFLDNDVAGLRHEIWVPFATPGALCESLAFA